MSEIIRGYHHTTQAWYHKVPGVPTLLNGAVDEVYFGLYAVEGGTTGEMAMRWYNLRDDGKPTPKLEAFSDSWQALVGFSDLLKNLASYGHPTPGAFCRILEQNGFKDLTERERR